MESGLNGGQRQGYNILCAAVLRKMSWRSSDAMTLISNEGQS